MAIWSLLPSVAQFGASVINKPKKIKMNDKYLKSYLANLRGDKISGDVRQKALEAESKVIGKKTGRAMRTIQAGGATPAQKSQAIVDLYSKETEALGGASDRASRLQEQRNADIDTRQRGIEEYIAKTKSQIEMQNELQQDQYKRGIISSGIGLAGSVAGKLGQDAEKAKALEVQKGQDVAFIEKLGMKPEEVSPENITSMLESGQITADQAKALVTRKPEEVKEKIFKKPDIIKKSLPGGGIQELEIDPKTGERIPFGEPYSRRAPTKPTVNSLSSWQGYAEELGVPKETIAKAKSYRTVKDLTEKMEGLQYKQQELADIDTALDQGQGMDEREQIMSEFSIGRTKLPYGSLETERINVLREISNLKAELGIEEERKSLDAIFGM